jgi:putative tricarboxylic transport membrane protein
MSTLVPWLRERSELGVSALLFAAGLLVLTDVLTAPRSGNASDPLGPNAVPFLLGALLLLLAVLLTVDVLRGGHGEAEAGEDIDLAVPADKRTVLTLLGRDLRPRLARLPARPPDRRGRLADDVARVRCAARR